MSKMSNVCGIWSMCVCVLCKSLYLCYTILSKIRCLYSNYILDCRVLVLYNIYKNFHFLALYMHFIFLFLFICSLIHWLVFFYWVSYIWDSLCASYAVFQCVFFLVNSIRKTHIFLCIWVYSVHTNKEREREREAKLTGSV